MMHLTFDAQKAREMLEASKQASERRTVFQQSCDAEYWRDDLDAARRAELDKDPYLATSKDIDPTKIPAGLWLVGDQGVYLMSNAPFDEEAAKNNAHIAFADEVNPETMEFDDWYDNKQMIFGADDGVEFLSAEMLEEALSSGAEKLVIDMDAESFKVLTMPTSPEPGQPG